MKTGQVSYVIPGESRVCEVRLDNKHIGDINLQVMFDASTWFQYVPKGVRGKRRQDLPTYATFVQCRGALEYPVSKAAREAQSTVGEPETVPAG